MRRVVIGLLLIVYLPCTTASYLMSTIGDNITGSYYAIFLAALFASRCAFLFTEVYMLYQFVVFFHFHLQRSQNLPQVYDRGTIEQPKAAECSPRTARAISAWAYTLMILEALHSMMILVTGTLYQLSSTPKPGTLQLLHFYGIEIF